VPGVRAIDAKSLVDAALVIARGLARGVFDAVAARARLWSPTDKKSAPSPLGRALHDRIVTERPSVENPGADVI